MNLPRGWELVLLVAVIVLLFGAKRLPDAARGVGRSLRIFKAETKGLADDSDSTPESLPAAPEAAAPAPAPAPAPAAVPTEEPSPERTES